MAGSENVLFEACLVRPAAHRLPGSFAPCYAPSTTTEDMLWPSRAPAAAAADPRRHPPPARSLPQEAFQLAQAHAAPAEGEEFPGLDWQGWEEIAAALGIEETVDAPVFRWVLPACSACCGSGGQAAACPFVHCCSS